MIALDGQTLQGKSFKLDIESNISGTDASGTGSDTANVDTGMKPKVLLVSYLIPKVNAAWLTAINDLSEKRTNNQRHVFTIVNATAEAMRIKQVKFNGKLKVKDQDTLQAWIITLKLLEFRSPAERVEAAETLPEPVAQTPSNATPVNAEPAAEPLTEFEQNLKRWDDMLGGNDETG